MIIIQTVYERTDGKNNQTHFNNEGTHFERQTYSQPLIKLI